MTAEIRRLNAQVDLFWDTELPLLQRYGLRDGMDVLDCGCGPGRLIALLKGAMPNLRCTGLEMDPRLVDAAGLMISEHGLTGCRVVQGTVEQPGLEASSFDMIILRLVLEHVLDPVLALGSVRRLLRPAGKLVVISNDFDFHLRTWPHVPQLDMLYDAYRRSRRKDGGDPCIGRKLPHLFSLAELSVSGFEIEVAHNAIVGDQAFLRAEGAGIPARLVKDGFLDEVTLDAMTHSWKDMLSCPDHSIMRPLFVCAGRRAEGVSGDGQKASASVQRTVHADGNGSDGDANSTLATLLSHVGKVLDGKSAGPDDRLADLGVDSLAAMDLQEAIKGSCGVELSITKLLENRSIISLAQEIEGELARQGGRPVSGVATNEAQSVQWEEGTI